MVLRKMFKKKVLAALLAVAMVMGMTGVEANAASVTTGVHSSSGGYTYYVRQSGSTVLLGTMHLSKDTIAVYNTFTAAKACGYTTVYVSESSSTRYRDKSVASLSNGASVIVSKSASRPSMIYGYCSVSY